VGTGADARAPQSNCSKTHICLDKINDKIRKSDLRLRHPS